MFNELIDAIQTGVKGEPVTINGKEFSTAKVYDAPEPRIASALQTKTLQSVVSYIEDKIDTIGDVSHFVHVESPTSVSICLHLDATNRREERLSASYDGHNFQFGREYDQSSFITLLRSQFVPSESREELQRFVGSLTDESSVKLEDDGVSQRTVAKKGITTLAVVENNKPIVLSPFRTFPEIEQPESEFIFRLHRRDGAAPTISLHEADNQAWKLEAINRIAEWLHNAGVKAPILT